jgi:hexulose-6-phosphate isomerase
MNRRAFVQSTVQSALALAVAPPPAAGRLPIHTAVEYSMLPATAGIPERFQIATAAGFERIECPTTRDPAEAQKMKDAAAAAGIEIHSVMNMDHWKYPLSSSDPAVVEKSLDGARVSLHNAKLWGAETVLIVPAVVNAETSYRDAYKRSQENIRKLIPLAEELRVVVAIEEVWNKFLLSPLEFAKYIDEFESPWIRSYFDVGNVVLYGYPQDWIRTLGPRIVKLHIKDFSWRKLVAKWVPLGEGDIDWHAIYAALRDIGYKGTATVELPAGDPAYLKEVCRRLDAILENQLAV